MECWSCGTQFDVSLGKVSFRATCDKCHAALHCCRNCKYYKPGCPNDCMVPGTEFVSDRTAANFCEEFALLGIVQLSKDNQAKKRFDDLFK